MLPFNFFLELKGFVFTHDLYERIDAFGGGAGGTGISHLKIILIAGIEEVHPFGRGLHVVFGKKLGIGEETQRNDADTGPVVSGVAEVCGNRVGILRAVGFKNTVLHACGIGVGRSPEHDVNLGVAAFGRESRKRFTGRKTQEINLDAGVFGEFGKDAGSILFRHDRIGVKFGSAHVAGCSECNSDQNGRDFFIHKTFPSSDSLRGGCGDAPRTFEILTVRAASGSRKGGLCPRVKPAALQMKKARGFISRTAGNEEISAALYCGCLVWGFFTRVTLRSLKPQQSSRRRPRLFQVTSPGCIHRCRGNSCRP